MYSPVIAERNLDSLRNRGLKFDMTEIPFAVERIADLKGLVLQDQTPSKVPKGTCEWKAADGSTVLLSRELTAREKQFVRSEQILCRYDFRYWADRYGAREIDGSEGGGAGIAKFWPSQLRALDLIAKREEECYGELAEHGFTSGIYGVWHKTRQQGATALIRLISGHRLSLVKATRSIAASLDETKVSELYKRDKIWLDSLPFYLKPKVEYDVKDEHISFEMLRSRVTYQKASQQAGIGTGQQFDMAHMTEVALWPNPWRLEFDFLPALPKSINTFCAFESTADGKGDENFWYSFTEKIRQKERGFEQWIYAFTPWYINDKKNRLPAPHDWSPNTMTLAHAQLIEQTSIEYAGVRSVPSRHQLYWWESEYIKAQKMGQLAVFFTNYPATPEQSFQYSSRPALPYETMEWMRATAATPGMPYDLSGLQVALGVKP